MQAIARRQIDMRVEALLEDRLHFNQVKRIESVGRSASIKISTSLSSRVVPRAVEPKR
jgi:hypothetical protein